MEVLVVINLVVFTVVAIKYFRGDYEIIISKDVDGESVRDSRRKTC